MGMLCVKSTTQEKDKVVSIVKLEKIVNNVKIQIKQSEIFEENVNAIVNAVDSSLEDNKTSLIAKAGFEKILKEEKDFVEKNGELKFGQAYITSAGNLNCQNLIHMILSIWKGGQANESDLLREGIRNAFKIANEKKFTSIAFSDVFSGNFRYPLDISSNVLIDEILDYARSENEENTVKLVLVIAIDLKKIKNFTDNLEAKSLKISHKEGGKKEEEEKREDIAIDNEKQEKLEEKLEEKQEKLENKQEKLEKAEEKLEEKQEKLDEKKEKLEKNIEKLEENQEKLEEDKEKLEENKEKLENEKEKLEEKKEELEEKIQEGANQEEIKKEMEEIEKQEEKIEQQEEKVEKLEENVEKQEEKVEEQEQKVEELEEKVEKLEEKVEKQEEKVENLEEKVENLEEKVENLEEKVEEKQE